MSLLTNPFFAIGTGLLGSANTRNPWGGISDGLLTMQRGQAIEQQNAYRQQQMQQMQNQEAQRRMQNAREAAQRERQQQYISGLPPEQQALLQAGGPAAVGDYIKQQMAPPEAPSEYVVNPQTGEQKLVTPQSAAGLIQQGWQKYEKPESTSTGTQKDYEAAVRQGYAGTLMDFKRDMASAAAPKIDMGGSDRVSTTEAASMAYPDGSPVPPGELWETARAKGAKVVSREEQAAENKRGTTNAVNAQALEEADSLLENYRQKFKAYQEGYGVMGMGAAGGNAKEARDALVAWYAKNVLGTPGAEPSPSLYERAETAIPDFSGAYDRKAFEAKLKGVESTLRGKLSGSNAPAGESKPEDAQRATDVQALVDRYAPN